MSSSEHFFLGIPLNEQRLTAEAWAKKHGGELPLHLAAIPFSPRSAGTAGEWVARNQSQTRATAAKA
ncbi:MAG: hypothetical protein KGJ93_02485 [Patescibacteria group bacterium]|nr:hypothetical protein [Patescibacteria group bacterium]